MKILKVEPRIVLSTIFERPLGAISNIIYENLEQTVTVKLFIERRSAKSMV